MVVITEYYANPTEVLFVATNDRWLLQIGLPSPWPWFQFD